MSIINSLTSGQMGDFQTQSSNSVGGSNLLQRLEESVSQALKFDGSEVNMSENFANEVIDPQEVREAIADIAVQAHQPFAGMNFNSIV